MAAYWFATAPGARWRYRLGGEVERVALGVVHAKDMGTLAAACGRPTGSWTKLWEQSFPPQAGEVCRSCAEIVARSRRNVGATAAAGPTGTQERAREEDA